MLKKNAVVTGGGRGIGLAITTALLRHQYNVAICDIDLQSGEQELNRLKGDFPESKCSLYQMDITNKDKFRASLEDIRRDHGPIHVLVNNAGVANDEMSKWETEVDINCKGTVWGCIYGLRYLEKGGIIINISSATVLDPYLLMPVYCMTKSAIVHITSTLGTSEYFETFGVKVMAVLPGITDTSILKTSRERYLFPDLGPAIRERALRMYGRPQSTKAVADCVMKAISSSLNGSLWLIERDREPRLVTIKYFTSDPPQEDYLKQEEKHS